MMRVIIGIIITVYCFLTSLQAQNNFNLKTGGYKYSFEYKDNTPINNFQFKVEKRSKEEIVNYGGNDYEVISADNKVKQKEIKRDYFGVFDGKDFYINAFPYTGYFWYAKAESFGKYIYFKGVPPLNKKIQDKIGFEKTTYTFAFTLVGGAILGGIVNTIEETQNAKLRIPILLNVETGEAIYLTIERLYIILSKFQDLKQDYFKETEITEDVIVKLIDKLNEKDVDLSFSAQEIDDQRHRDLEKQLIELETNLYITEKDSSYQDYYKRILMLTDHPKFESTKLFQKEYSNGNLKSIGIKSRQMLGEFVDDFYESESFYSKIGTWRYYYEDEQLKRIVNYNLKGKKDGKYLEYDKNGKLTKKVLYKQGKKIK